MFCTSTDFTDRAVTSKDPERWKVNLSCNLNPGYKLGLHLGFSVDLINYHISAQGTLSTAFHSHFIDISVNSI